MAQLDLTGDEAAVLRQALESYLSDLRMEIADTDQMDYRQELKRQEEILTRLEERLSFRRA
jgi:tRNA A-37 threonylcarbamoyl transferase component Bud32